VNVKKRLHKPIHGWLPKDQSFPNQAFEVNQNPKKLTQTKLYIGIFAAAFATEFIVLSVLYLVGAGSYVSYAAGAAAVIITIVVSILLSKPHKQIEMENRLSTEGEKRASTMIGIVNIVMAGIMLGTYFLIQPIIKSSEVTLGLWTALLLTWLLVNNLLYRNYKKQAPPSGGMTR
jgi:hypothetical protein